MTASRRVPGDAGVWLALAGLGLLLVAGVLTARYITHATQRRPLQRSPDVAAIASWMTLPYIARVYGVPEDLLLTRLGVNEIEARRSSLRDIARAQGKDESQVVAMVRAVVVAYRQPTPAPPTPSSRAGLALEAHTD